MHCDMLMIFVIKTDVTIIRENVGHVSRQHSEMLYQCGSIPNATPIKVSCNII